MTDSEQTFAFSETPKYGQLIKNRYKLQQELGKGGMGVVYLAHDTQLHNRPVVIKVLRDAAAEDWLTKIFRQEIEALVRIEHPGVVGIFDTGEMPNGQLFVVMQFVEGVNLRSVLTRQENHLNFDEAARIIDQVGRALTAAHDKGVLHCDLKPENIMLQMPHPGEEIVKLIDFGIAKIRDSNVTSAEPTKIAGTMEYMAPEQLTGTPTTASDIFSLGIVAYEMLTGKKPFPAQNLFQLVEMHRTGVKEPPKNLRPELPETAQAVILKALSFDPDKRYKRARDFGEQLQRALRQDSNVAPTARLEERVSGAKTKDTGIPGRKISRVGIALNLLLVVVAVLIAFWAFRSSDKPAPIIPSPAPLPEITLNYHMMLQETDDAKPFRLPKEVLFKKGHRIQLFVTAPKSGYLYLMNEGPGGFIVLFPSTLNNNGSAHLMQNQEIKIPGKDWFIFDEEQGTEKIWMVFSPKLVPELESVKSVANPEKFGSITDLAMIRTVTTFFQNHSPDKTESKRDFEKNQTLLKAKGDLLLYQLLLEHH
ncbi:serine/threonine-protein kinase [bacterium]|nr:serine/threonine-protein kinase [bacterium]